MWNGPVVTSDPEVPPSSGSEPWDAADPFDVGPFTESPAPEQEDLPPVESRTKRRRHEKRRGLVSFLVELPVLILVALVVAVLIKTFFVQAFFIPSGSMIPTLEVDDRVMVKAPGPLPRVTWASAACWRMALLNFILMSWIRLRLVD